MAVSGTDHHGSYEVVLSDPAGADSAVLTTLLALPGSGPTQTAKEVTKSGHSSRAFHVDRKTFALAIRAGAVKGPTGADLFSATGETLPVTDRNRAGNVKVRASSSAEAMLASKNRKRQRG